MEQKVLNGVNVSELGKTIHTVKEAPELAKFRFRAHNKWINGGHAVTVIHDFYGAGKEDTHITKFEMAADEPEVMLGEDHGPNATEAALHALASCLNATFAYHAAALGVQIEKLEFELEGDLDVRGFLGVAEGVRNGFDNIRVVCKVKSDAPPEKLDELCALAQKRSPVFDIVTHGVPVSVKLETM